MNKANLVEAMAKYQKNTKAEAERWLNCTLSTIRQGLKKDKTVQLVGFGTFAVKNRKARTGRNPRTGETIQIKASRHVGFRASRDLKKWV